MKLTGLGWTPLYVGLGASFALWLYGMFDADNAARRHNEKLYAAQSTVAPFLVADQGRSGFGLRIRW